MIELPEVLGPRLLSDESEAIRRVTARQITNRKQARNRILKKSRFACRNQLARDMPSVVDAASVSDSPGSISPGRIQSRQGDRKHLIELYQRVAGVARVQIEIDGAGPETQQFNIAWMGTLHEGRGKSVVVDIDVPDPALNHFRTAVTRARSRLSPAATARQEAVVALAGFLWSQGDLGTPEAIELSYNEYLACSELLGPEHRISARYLDRTLAMVTHDHTGGLALAAAQRALQIGGTAPSTIRALLQLSLASQHCLRPSLFDTTSPPLPEAFFRLLEVESMSDTGISKIPLPAELLANDAEWRFIAQGEGEVAPAGWDAVAFDDSNWHVGAAPIGSADQESATDVHVESAPGGAVASVCFRRRFAAPPNSDTDPALLRLRCADGAVIYLNGQELVRFNLPKGALGGHTQAIAKAEPRTRDYLIPAGRLVDGENVLAARVFTAAGAEPNLHFSAVLYHGVPLPIRQLANFEPAPAIAHLDTWLPGLTTALEANWMNQVECAQLALLGKWGEAFTKCDDLVPASSEAAARHQWFQRRALERLGRDDEVHGHFRSAIPARDPAATPEMIDLTDYYNALVSEAWHVTTDGHLFESFLKDFPVGMNTFDGITFDVRGLIQMTTKGLESLPSARDFPKSVEGIPIGRVVGKLHFLNATFLPDAKDTVVATVVVHFADGTKDQIPLRYMRETLNYMVGTDPPPPEVISGWRGPDPYRPGISKELFIATWTNPRSDVEVTSVDLRSEHGANAAVFVAGMTIDPRE